MKRTRALLRHLGMPFRSFYGPSCQEWRAHNNVFKFKKVDKNGQVSSVRQRNRCNLCGSRVALCVSSSFAASASARWLRGANPRRRQVELVARTHGQDPR